MADETIVLLGCGLYLALLLAVGVFVGRRVKDSADFIVAGRRLPLWLCTFTLFATWFGAGTCMGAAGAAYASGVLGTVADPFGAGLCLFLAGLFYVRVAQNSAYLSGFLYLTVGLVPVALGIVGATVIKDIADPEFILPALGLKYLHPVVMALFVGALLSALRSSADSALLAPASIFGQNVVKRFKSNASERDVLRMIRGTVLGIAILSLAIVFYFQNAYDLMVNSWAVLLVFLFAPLTAGLYWKEANGPAALSSIIVGLVAWIAFAYMQSEYPADLIAAALSAFTLVVVTLATYKEWKPLPLSDLEGNPVAYADRLGALGFFGRR